MRKVLGPLGLLLNRDPFTPASLALGLLVLAGSYAEHAGLVPAGVRDQLARALEGLGSGDGFEHVGV